QNLLSDERQLLAGCNRIGEVLKDLRLSRRRAEIDRQEMFEALHSDLGGLEGGDLERRMPDELETHRLRFFGDCLERLALEQRVHLDEVDTELLLRPNRATRLLGVMHDDRLDVEVVGAVETSSRGVDPWTVER